jgi:hypothetical protein
MEEKTRKLAKKLQVVQECKEPEEEVARKAEEVRQKAEAEEKAKVEREAKEACKVEEARQKAEAEQKAQEPRKAAEKHEAEEANNAERVCLKNRKRLDRELIEFKEQMEAEERKKAEEEEKAKAGNGMKLATPADLSALERAWLVNAENARLRDDSRKPRVVSSKAATTPTPKPKTPVNLACQVREEERLKKTRKWGKGGDVAVSNSFQFSSAFLTYISPGCHV